jgi:hypothetical protein
LENDFPKKKAVFPSWGLLSGWATAFTGLKLHIPANKRAL